jgi:RNA methyltransferase, TrmH family
LGWRTASEGGPCKNKEKQSENRKKQQAGMAKGVESLIGSREMGRTMDRARKAGEAGDLISSRDNRWLKEFRVALRGGLATEKGCVGVEGMRLVEEALGSGCRVEAVLFSESGERHRERLAPLIGRREMAFPVLKTTDRLFEGIADTEHPQGVAALVEPRKVEIADLLATPEGACAPLLVVLAGMSLAILLTQLKMNGIHTLASCVQDAKTESVSLSPWEVDWCQAIALLVGNEGAGLPEEIVRGADARVHIPMARGVESLNAAAAAAVMFYEGFRQREKMKQ